MYRVEQRRPGQRQSDYKIFYANRNLPEDTVKRKLDDTEHFSFSPSKPMRDNNYLYEDQETKNYQKSTGIMNRNEAPYEYREDSAIFETNQGRNEKELRHFSQNYRGLDVSPVQTNTGAAQDSPVKREIADKMIDILQTLGNTGKESNPD